MPILTDLAHLPGNPHHCQTPVAGASGAGDGVVVSTSATAEALLLDEPGFADNVRTMYRVDVIEGSDGRLAVELEAPSFTRGLVRNIVGYVQQHVHSLRTLWHCECDVSTLVLLLLSVAV
jgi:hypothetical protein